MQGLDYISELSQNGFTVKRGAGCSCQNQYVGYAATGETIKIQYDDRTRANKAVSSLTKTMLYIFRGDALIYQGQIPNTWNLFLETLATNQVILK